MTLQNLTRRWIEASGGTYRKGVSQVRVIGGTLASARVNDIRHSSNVANVSAYLMKGARDETGEELELRRYGEGGSIIGKRRLDAEWWASGAQHSKSRCAMPRLGRVDKDRR